MTNTPENIDRYIRATFASRSDNELKSMSRALTILTLGVTPDDLDTRIATEIDRREALTTEKARAAKAADEARINAEVERRVAQRTA